MRRVGALAAKELVVIWTSPLPFVGGAVFNALLGLLYVGQLEERQQALIQPMFPLAGFLLVVVVPVLTMRAFADETRSGSLDLLVVAGVPRRVLVGGKWVAAWLTTLVMLSPTALFVVLLHLYGNPDPGPIVAGYIGLVMLAAVLTGIGVLASSLTSSAPVAVVGSLFCALVLWFVHLGTDSIVVNATVTRFSLSERLRSFAGGGIDTGDVAFFVLTTLAVLALTAVSLDSRRLR
jgi:ABC-2 type transport system permease protein